jgi:hypothetical protein
VVETLLENAANSKYKSAAITTSTTSVDNFLFDLKNLSNPFAVVAVCCMLRFFCGRNRYYYVEEQNEKRYSSIVQ